MTIAQVLYVLEIADCRSISAAAERQFISQSALSQQIQRRPDFPAAAPKVPDPPKKSQTRSPGLLPASKMRSSRASGFCVA